MAVIPVYLGNSYVETEDSGVHFEGYAETRVEIASASTDFAVGSFIYCGEDGSKWILGSSSGTKEWQEMTA